MEPALSYLSQPDFPFLFSPDATLHSTQEELRKGTQVGRNLRYHLPASTGKSRALSLLPLVGMAPGHHPKPRPSSCPHPRWRRPDFYNCQC